MDELTRTIIQAIHRGVVVSFRASDDFVMVFGQLANEPTKPGLEAQYIPIQKINLSKVCLLSHHIRVVCERLGKPLGKRCGRTVSFGQFCVLYEDHRGPCETD